MLARARQLVALGLDDYHRFSRAELRSRGLTAADPDERVIETASLGDVVRIAVAPPKPKAAPTKAPATLPAATTIAAWPRMSRCPSDTRRSRT